MRARAHARTQRQLFKNHAFVYVGEDNQLENKHNSN